MIQDFSPRGVYYLEITCGENERSAYDYLQHYRSPHLLGIDADYAMSRAYSAQSWPTFVVVDAAGVIQFHGFDTDRNMAGVRRCLEKLLGTATSAPGPVLEHGIACPAEILASRKARRDFSPRLAFDGAGNPQLVYHSNRSGTNAVYLRRYNAKGEQTSDQQLSPVGLEGYAPDCVTDSQGRLWVAWCGRTNSIYDIYVQSLSAGQPRVTEQLTASDDDAMSPKIAAGPAGQVVVTYYEWARMGGISRDRNIFARVYDPQKRAWSPEAEISPPKPEVEDHTDPDVVVEGSGKAWVVWSYDYHPQLFKEPVDASQPTIFAAQFAAGQVSSATLVGASGKLRDAIDLFPSAALDAQGVLWCAWDCSEPQRRIQLTRRDPASGSFRLTGAFGTGTASTPELAPTKAGLLLLAWSERSPSGAWQGKVALLKEGQAVAKTTLSGERDVLFPQAQESAEGQYWVAFEESDAKGTQVAVRKVGLVEGAEH